MLPQRTRRMLCEVCGCPAGRWLSVGVIATHFRCSRKRVRRLIKMGELDAMMVGREWRVDHESLDRLVRRQSVRFSETGPRRPAD